MSKFNDPTITLRPIWRALFILRCKLAHTQAVVIREQTFGGVYSPIMQCPKCNRIWSQGAAPCNRDNLSYFRIWNVQQEGETNNER